jgi:hypothetical protein
MPPAPEAPRANRAPSRPSAQPTPELCERTLVKVGLISIGDRRSTRSERPPEVHLYQGTRTTPCKHCVTTKTRSHPAPSSQVDSCLRAPPRLIPGGRSEPAGTHRVADADPRRPSLSVQRPGVQQRVPARAKRGRVIVRCNAMLSGAPFKQLHHLRDSRFDRAACRANLEPVAHALERGVVKGENEMPPLPKGVRAVTRMNRVHLLEAPDPGRVAHFERTVRLQPARCQGMAGECFVIGWTEHVRVTRREPYDRDRFTCV